MIGLLEDPRINDIDILAIQEPWRNPINRAEYNLINSQFLLIEEISKNTRSAIYINKRIPTNIWSEVHKEQDLITIQLQLQEIRIYIHAIYIEPPNSHSERQTLEVLYKL